MQQIKTLKLSAFETKEINALVERFYTFIHEDDLLGPIFANEMSLSWDNHIARMQQFWRSVLMKTREYNGRPVPAHTKITGLETKHFVRWLSLFRNTAYEIFSEEKAEIAITYAENIASSLWLAVNNSPFATQPQWNLLHEHSLSSTTTGAAK